MKNFSRNIGFNLIFCALAFSFVLLSAPLSIAANTTGEADTTIRDDSDRLENGEGSVGRGPASLRFNTPGYDCPVEGCKAASLKESNSQEPVDSAQKTP